MRNMISQTWTEKKTVIPFMVKIRRRSKFLPHPGHDSPSKNKVKVQKELQNRRKKVKFGRIGPLEGED